MNDPLTYRNAMLNALPANDLVALRPGLEPVDMPRRRRMATPNRPIEHVYFLDSGIGSATASMLHEIPVEIGMIGWEGVCNLPALLGADRTPADVYMQAPGAGHRIELDRMRGIMADRPGITRLVLLWSYFSLAQVSGTALANSRGDVAERLARWLLMAHDRVGRDEVPLTHEFLAIMLGVRRAGVTTALSQLEHEGLVARSRGAIEIRDRKGLIQMAGGFYGAPEAEAKRLIAALAAGD